MADDLHQQRANVGNAPDVAPASPLSERPAQAEVEAALRVLIRWTGDDPDREGLVDTPARVARAFEEFFAGYAVDDLVGWKERKDGETKSFPGVLASHSVSRADAEQMVMWARLKVGWITEEDLAVEEQPAEAAEA